ncbi:NADH-quinone oxidoreductase subunit C [Mucilaginibacter terrenus]|uniref:NADH-quinone oxidoreductase subunit C n=1 Tax=Mucilaginibacter terrenus TaxID=2482727 RepID=A0A3E2NPT0_9SPHI|nr:NADH-quinone oxidoreductase subunit C [Mucilaginibacter terrenus]RFZ82961.1 NADH-quinone oxidoreductase subunit C [Mucilaginibacter terrenus]
MGKIANEVLVEKLAGRFGDQVMPLNQDFGLLAVETTKELITDVLAYLKQDEELKFIFLTDITAIHYPELEKSIGVIYHLHSLTTNTRICVKVFLTADNVHIPTATNLWEGANWMERETYDFFGVVFDGHPDLRRILNVDDMTVFPMRKEFPLEDPNRIDKKDYFFGR